MSLQTLKNSSVIIRDVDAAAASIESNQWAHCLLATPAKGETATVLNLSDLPQQACSVPLAFWLENREQLQALTHDIAVQIAASDDVQDIVSHLAEVATIILPFESSVDGRSYSHAYLLRTRHGFTGEIRAVGDVHHDHLNFLARVGCNAFELPEGEDLSVACSAFTAFSEVYQPSADGQKLIYSRRRAIH